MFDPNAFRNLLSLAGDEYEVLYEQNRKLVAEQNALHGRLASYGEREPEPKHSRRFGFQGSRYLCENMGCEVEGQPTVQPTIARMSTHGSRQTVADFRRQTIADFLQDSTELSRGSIPAVSQRSSTTSVAHGSRVFQWRAPGNHMPLRGRQVTLQLALQSADMTTASQGTFAINPSTSRFLNYWDRVTAIALLFVVIVTPVHVAMSDVSLDAMFVVNAVVDMVFFADMVLQFIIMSPRDTVYGSVLEHRPRHIAMKYMKSWFLVDLVSTIPFDALTLSTPGMSDGHLKAVKVVRVLRIMKLTRVTRASRILHRFESRMSIMYKTLSLIQFFVILAIITHWLTSLWALTLVLVEASEGVPRWIDDFDTLDANVVIKTKDSAWKLYLTCLYFTTYTLTSVGYGDIGPKNIVERVVCTLIIIISGTSWALVLGQVGGIVANLNPAEQAFRTEMDNLQFMMADQMVPMDLQHRIRAFFRANKTAQRRAQHHYLLQTMSLGLRGEIMIQLNSEWITKVRLLNMIWQDADLRNSLLLKNFIYEVAMSMTLEAHAQAEYFGTPHALYILNRGLVSRRTRLFSKGSVWGADFVLVNPELLEPVESLTLTYVEVTTLKRSMFFQLVEKHQAGCPKLQGHVRYFVRWFAFQRAILFRAKEEQKEKGTKRPSPVPVAPIISEDSQEEPLAAEDEVEIVAL